MITLEPAKQVPAVSGGEPGLRTEEAGGHLKPNPWCRGVNTGHHNHHTMF